METKRIDPAALASMTTGVLLVDFPIFHEAAEWVAGHPIWTHEFADSESKDRLEAEVMRQFPEMPNGKPDDWQKTRDYVRARFGETVEVQKGSGVRGEDPITSAERMIARKS